jgi:hypothetical protein
MNPLVAAHLEFLTEETKGSNVYKVLQSFKWLKNCQLDLQVQMVESNSKHFYIFKPIQLKNHNTLIPIFFYTQNAKTYSKCFGPIINSNPDFSQVEIQVSLGIFFDDEKLLTILVDKFDLTSDKIQLRNGENLSECCGDCMIGESSKQGVISFKQHIFY